VLLWSIQAVRAPAAQQPALVVNTPCPPPAWALLERELLRANAVACRQFFDRYFDERGYLQCVERWGADDGPDDAIECVDDWPLLHALGAPDDVLTLYKRAWEGHLRQYTQARTTEVPLARGGMYYREFPVMFDWVHNGEGLTPFNLQGLSDPSDAKFQQRVRRFAGFYIGEDATAPNYDSQHKIIRSLFNGSRGPLLRKATALDWAGDPIEIASRFHPQHGERSYAEMLEHFKDYTDVIGDHPLNLLATSLALNAFMLSGEVKYRRWLLEYVDAWRQRAASNGDVIPSNVGLDGKIGSAAGGKWYGGAYGWGFTVFDPGSRKMVDRNTHRMALTGFGNALLLTGDQRYVDVWRRQTDAINAQARQIDGRTQYPTMYGDQGWYSFQPHPYAIGSLEIYYWSMDRADRVRIASPQSPAWPRTRPHWQRKPQNDWLAFLDGQKPDYPEAALRADLDAIRQQAARIAADQTTPDTRLADDPMNLNPASVTALVQLMLGGLYPGNQGSPLHCRLRYFDSQKRRAGMPEDVAALVTQLTADSVTVELVNVSPVEARTLLIQAGGYGEHQFTSATLANRTIPLAADAFSVRLGPGCGAKLVIHMRRYANAPTLLFPWEK
jgi:hypothetical protein